VRDWILENGLCVGTLLEIDKCPTQIFHCESSAAQHIIAEANAGNSEEARV
jgi:hypothetical protein